MIIQEKALKLQRSIFVLLIIFGLFAIGKVYFEQAWFLVTVLGLAVAFIVGTYILYRKRSDADVVSITEKQLKSNKIVLYSYIAVYIGYLLLDGNVIKDPVVAAWIFGPILVIIGAVGVVIQQITLKNKK